MAEYIEREAVFKVINGTNSFSFSRNVDNPELLDGGDAG